MEFMFCDLHVSLNNPSSGDINSSNLPCFSVPIVYKCRAIVCQLTVFSVSIDFKCV